MNTFKVVLMICATLSASCSGQYTSQSGTPAWATQQPAASQPMNSYADLSGMKGQSQLPLAVHGSDAMAGSALKCASTATTTQICSCVTVNAGQQSADNTGSNQASAPVATSISSQSSQSQSYSAPTASSSSGSQQSYASQSAPAQSGGDHRGPAMAAYPAAAAPAQTSGGY